MQELAVPAVSRLSHGDGSAHRRSNILVVAMVVAVVKLTIAVRSHGTTDVFYWQNFAHDVDRLGPVGIYATRHFVPFNHPPLAAGLLAFLNTVARHGPTIRFLIRVPAILSDIGSTLLIFEIVSNASPRRVAYQRAIAFALSPIMLVISGFHGNTDPVFIFAVLLAVYWTTTVKRPLWSGVAMGCALGIKLVPIVAVPAFLVMVFRHVREPRRWLVGFCSVSALIWMPAAVSQWDGLVRNVFSYQGGDPRTSGWGIAVLAQAFNVGGVADFLAGPARFVLLIVCAGIPVLIIWRRPQHVSAGVFLSLSLLLFVTPGFGTQYLVWGAVGTLLADFDGGVLYNSLAGLLVMVVYTRWSGTLPWDRAIASTFTSGERLIALAAWLALGRSIVSSIRTTWQSKALTLEVREVSIIECRRDQTP